MKKNSNIFSRNPKKAQLLHEYEYVREFCEGVDRMYREMEKAGLPKPEYKTVAFMVHATIKNKKYIVDVASAIACDLLGVKERRARSVLADRDCRKRIMMLTTI